MHPERYPRSQTSHFPPLTDFTSRLILFPTRPPLGRPWKPARVIEFYPFYPDEIADSRLSALFTVPRRVLTPTRVVKNWIWVENSAFGTRSCDETSPWNWMTCSFKPLWPSAPPQTSPGCFPIFTALTRLLHPEVSGRIRSRCATEIHWKLDFIFFQTRKKQFLFSKQAKNKIV